MDRLRSPVRWYGGKGQMISKLTRLVPAGGSPYCEPFSGGASLFFSRDPAPVYWPLETNGWEKIEYKTACHAAGRTRASKLQGKGNGMKHAPRTEIVWRNRKAVELCGV